MQFNTKSKEILWHGSQKIHVNFVVRRPFHINLMDTRDRLRVQIVTFYVKSRAPAKGCQCEKSKNQKR